MLRRAHNARLEAWATPHLACCRPFETALRASLYQETARFISGRMLKSG